MINIKTSTSAVKAALSRHGISFKDVLIVQGGIVIETSDQLHESVTGEKNISEALSLAGIGFTKVFSDAVTGEVTYLVSGVS